MVCMTIPMEGLFVRRSTHACVIISSFKMNLDCLSEQTTTAGCGLAYMSTPLLISTRLALLTSIIYSPLQQSTPALTMTDTGWSQVSRMMRTIGVCTATETVLFVWA